MNFTTCFFFFQVSMNWNNYNGGIHFLLRADSCSLKQMTELAHNISV